MVAVAGGPLLGVGEPSRGPSGEAFNIERNSIEGVGVDFWSLNFLWFVWILFWDVRRIMVVSLYTTN